MVSPLPAPGDPVPVLPNPAGGQPAAPSPPTSASPPAAAPTTSRRIRRRGHDMTKLEFEILPQPTDTTCGPTCLHAVYRYFGDEIPLDQVIDDIPQLLGGGTLAVALGCHALRRGYQAAIYTFDLQVFDPTWFRKEAPSLESRLTAQMAVKESSKLRLASEAYLEFLQRGGKIRMADLTGDLIRRYLKRQIPILTGLSATYLYRDAREYGPHHIPDDVRGYPQGHFVVLCGYGSRRRGVLVADPYLPNPLGPRHHYLIGLDRVMCAILLGILTYDANLLIIQPRKER